MKKNKFKKQKNRDTENLKMNINFILVFPKLNDKESMLLLLDSLEKTKSTGSLDIKIVFNKEQKQFWDAIENHELANDLFDKKKILFSNKSNVLSSLNESKNINNEDQIIIFNNEKFNKSFNIWDLIATIKREREDSKIESVYFNDSPSKDKARPKKAPIISLSGDFYNYIQRTFNKLDENFLDIVFYCARKLNIPIEQLIVAQHDPMYKFPGSSKRFFSSISLKLKLFFLWFFKIPLTEQKDKPHETYSFIKENSIYRFIYSSLAVLLFILMPLMSLDTGISGDEDKHVNQAEKVTNYFITMGEDTSYNYSKWGPFYAYNITYDVALHLAITTLNIEKIYEFRHWITAWVGWLCILFVGLFTRHLVNWRAAIFSSLLLFLTPAFLGHTYNNPKDIPFAFGYIFTIYYIFKSMKEIPSISFKNMAMIAIGIGLTLNIRIGGLLLIAYLGFFWGLRALSYKKFSNFFSKEKIILYKRLLIYFVLIALSGYIIGFIFWPFGLKNPIKNPFESLEIMTNFTVSLRQIFDGNVIWSDNVPWYYSLKYIFITVPIIVFLSLAFFIVFFGKIVREHKFLYIFLILFAFLFPVFYVIYKESNVYGGWRHLLFSYQFMIIASAIGVEKYLQLFKKRLYLWIAYVPLIILAYFPLSHIIKNHPHEYIYYNEFIGGIDEAYGKYETDYYYHSIREGAYWMKENILDKTNKEQVLVASNFTPAVNYYLRDEIEENKVKIIYIRYYDRGNTNWDYAILANSYINPYHLKRNTWPPKNTIHRVEVDDVPVGAVVERKDKSDYQGYQALQNRNYRLAEKELKEALALDPNNEAAALNLTTVHVQTNQHDKAIAQANKLLKVYPNYDKALNLLGIAYMNKNQLDNALAVFNRITEVNPKFVSSYYNMGLVYARMNNAKQALNYFNQAIEVNRRFKPAYVAAASVLRNQGQTEQASRYMEAANSL